VRVSIDTPGQHVICPRWVENDATLDVGCASLAGVTSHSENRSAEESSRNSGLG